MLYGSKVWLFGQYEVWIQQRTERSIVRAMHGLKLVHKKKTKGLMQ